ncbi:MAG: GNAT family N-acetyltransferase [Candidatus Schekmanbacteria bacterium]|nr:MAG: GNAT family N-acetyltransferase [Candidatus Schekmanbacteria bacterium]
MDMEKGRKERLKCYVVDNEKEMNACFNIRKSVFVDELKMFEESDVDSFDEEAVHIAVSDESGIIGTVRVYKDKKGNWFGGRLAVRKGKRHGIAGRLLVKKAEDIALKNGAHTLFALVQKKNVNFFKKLKWEVKEGPFEYYGILHYLMKTKLDK